ncbi:MAG: (2Fe-2S)-binding protein [Verrucomicrobia bacterium]|nr:(2Fe-2S)-binding protein [Verrucomicrobiota bacterium]
MSQPQPSESSILQGNAGSIICFCERITELEIRTAIVLGKAETVDEVSGQTRAGTACRACHCRIQRMLEGKPPQCGGGCSRCDGCGWIAALCACHQG